MGFGDFHVISYQNFSVEHKLIIDCGSNLRTTRRYMTYLSNELSECPDKTDLLITHFHNDHYSIIRDHFYKHKSATPLRYLYLPTLPENENGRIDVFSVAFLQLLFTSDSSVHLSSAKFIDELPYSILSAVKCHYIIFTKQKTQIVNTQSGLEIKIACCGSVNHMVEVDGLVWELSQIVPEIKQFYHDYMIEHTVAWNDFQSGKLSDEKRERDFVSVYLDIKSKLKSRLPDKEYATFAKRVAEVYDLVINDSGYCIEVYDNLSLKALFLSDVSPEVYKPLLNNLNQHLRFIKLPHHGSLKYISEKLLYIQANYYIATNGKGKAKSANTLFDFSKTPIRDSLIITGNLIAPFELIIK